MRECGTILRKAAKDDDYTWGVRFYKLLSECFQAWAIMDESGEIAQSYEELRASGIPLLDEVVYYEIDASKLPGQHRVLEKILSAEETGANHNSKDVKEPIFPHEYLYNPYNAHENGNNSDVYLTQGQSKPNALMSTNRQINQYYDQMSDNRPNKFNSGAINELTQMKNEYLDALYSERTDPNRIIESQACFQSFFEAQQEELSKVLFGETQAQLSAKEKELALKDIEFGFGLQELFEKEYVNYSNKTDLNKMQKKVLELMSSIYSDVPLKYRKATESGSALLKQSPKYEMNNLNTSYDKGKDKYGPYNRYQQKQNDYRSGTLDLEGDLHLHENNNIKHYEDENQRLLSQQDKLKREIEELRRKERQLLSMKEKTETFKGKTDPRLLVEEFHNKNKEYEMLRGKYKILMQQLNDKAYIDYSNVKTDKDMLQRSIRESMSNAQTRNYRPSKSTYNYRPKPDLKESHIVNTHVRQAPGKRTPYTETVYLPRSTYNGSYKRY